MLTQLLSARPGRPRLPYWRLTLLLLLAYLLYLPFSGYTRLYHDSLNYWFISIYYHKQGSFSLLNFHDSFRGYLLPLLLLPLRIVQFYTNLPPILFARVFGAVSAAVGFGLIGPLLWQSAKGQREPLAWVRRLAFAALGFALWRDYFNFTLTDFPALWALGLGVLLLYNAGLWGVAGAGMCLAAACNMRPTYLISVPFFMALLAVLPLHINGGRRVARTLALLAGMALLWLPQLLINHYQFRQNSPLVLAQHEDLETDNLYREKLKWGLVHQKYETTIVTDYPQRVLIFRDVAGEQLVKAERIGWFDSYGSYLQLVLRHPLTFTKMYAWRLFNGLDVQYPTPYIKRVYVPTWGLAWLNYTVWFGALLVLLRTRFRKLRWHQWLVLAVLLMPCMPMLPMSMECRFLLPLHLLLYAVLCFGWPTAWHPSQLPRRQLAAVGVAYVGFVAVCFWASVTAQATLELGPRALW
ncbi:hypothetical protein KBK19_08115 [Microvirga sp. STR05]|uniref:Glycosyltransferase RgtA/B/C/D-like domain-containing protein n=1 Tax=Hymenobacter duratus TaxID=2771356 RepID=A0ABR8JDS1_9BACT|nr:hypothetical protein [Hymenobacter duratus]MBD2714996.1 hypothetical protein [Hymenobacter duratus]MBR7949902.1 hypothetical protein [Microvirga sp. STR05]